MVFQTFFDRLFPAPLKCLPKEFLCLTTELAVITTAKQCMLDRFWSRSLLAATRPACWIAQTEGRNCDRLCRILTEFKIQMQSCVLK